MDIENIQTEKLNLINWISNLKDDSLIKELMIVKNSANSIPLSQIKETRRRLGLVTKGSIAVRSWNEAQNEIFK